VEVEETGLDLPLRPERNPRPSRTRPAAVPTELVQAAHLRYSPADRL